MAIYNSGKQYNKAIPDGGANYNSGPFVIIIRDSGMGQDIVSDLLANVTLCDSATGLEEMHLVATLSPITDTGTGQDTLTLTADIPITDTGTGQDIISPLLCNVYVSDTGIGQDETNIAKIFFVIDADNILKPLNVLIVGDSRLDTFPKIKRYKEEIPGRHGDVDFGSHLGGRILELDVASMDGLSPGQKEGMKRMWAKYLNPVSGARPLVFWDDLEKTYNVKYAGKIDPEQYADWMKFAIPFRMTSAYIEGSFERKLTGNGTVKNSGNIETPFVLQITGPVQNPIVTVGDATFEYVGDIPSGQVLIIDTGRQAAELDGVNALDDVIGGSDTMLPPGETAVSAGASGGHVTIIWRERWI